MPSNAGGPEPSDDPAGSPSSAGRTVPRLSLPWLVIGVALAVFALLGWQGVSTVARDGPLDAAEYLLNAQYLDAHHQLPPDYVSYEYSTPPLFESLAIGLEHVARAAPAWPLELPWNAATRLLWLLLVVGSGACLASARSRVRLLGAAGLLLGGLWGLDEAVALAKTQLWSAGQLLSLAAALGFVVVSALIARELWPGRPLRMLGTAGFVLAYPVVLRLGVLFHPETTLAFVSAIATWLLIRAQRRGWTLGRGIAVGVFCGLALLSRQSAIVLVGCVLATALLTGGRAALRFTLALAAATILIAGPWLGYAASTWGNPLQGNLHRPGGLIPGGEPLSYYVSFPVGSLVLHPYRPRLTNELLPQLHADLWSDWFGAFHQPAFSDPSLADRVTASSQSVLGLVADALAIGGLAAFGIPALVRLVRRRLARGSDDDGPYGFLALLAVAGFIGLALQIVRYPQFGGKEIKASYLMFTAPAWAVFSVAAWVAVTRRRPKLKVALIAIASLYLVSYGASLAATFSRSYPLLVDPIQGQGYVDVATTLQSFNPRPRQGQEVDFAVYVANNGSASAPSVVLTINLQHGLRLLGPPSVERGPGCTQQAQVITCPLDFLPAGSSTIVRFAVEVMREGVLTATASATGGVLDANPPDNTASLTMVVGKYR